MLKQGLDKGFIQECDAVFLIYRREEGCLYDKIVKKNPQLDVLICQL